MDDEIHKVHSEGANEAKIGSNRIITGISYREFAAKCRYHLVLDFTTSNRPNPLTENLLNATEKYSCSIMLNRVQKELIHH